MSFSLNSNKPNANQVTIGIITTELKTVAPDHSVVNKKGSVGNGLLNTARGLNAFD